VREALQGLAGLDAALDRQQQRELGIDHPRSGELVCLAEADAWFAYPYWLEESCRPDFATTVDIHRKPGYDPVELFLDPRLAVPKLRIAWTLLKKVLGFRYLMNVIATDPTLVRGSHGLLPPRPELGPVYLCSEPEQPCDSVAATAVKDRLLALVFGRGA
jgi:hypothetical protein